MAQLLSKYFSLKLSALGAAKSMLKVLLHPPASEEDDVVKKQQVAVLSCHLSCCDFDTCASKFQLRELAVMNGTFKEHPSERAARMYPGRGGGSSGGHGGGGHDWQGGAAAAAAYADPAVIAYNRVRIEFLLLRGN